MSGICLDLWMDVLVATSKGNVNDKVAKDVLNWAIKY